mmetsp:Transcript_9619/g.20695  ORF Transcript_9619/g.20695 Transcript_9619/m.20695 type:complete len:251 (+) Transcript_9619:938-1690(+)
MHGCCSSMHWRLTGCDKGRCRGHDLWIDSRIGRLILRRTKFISNHMNAFVCHHHLLQSGMQFDLYMSTGSIRHCPNEALPVSGLDSYGLANQPIIALATSPRTAALMRLWSPRCGPAVASSGPILASGSSQNATTTLYNKYTSMLGSGLRMQEKLGSIHLLDGGVLSLVPAFHDIDRISTSQLVSLNIQSYRSSRHGILFSAQFFWAHLTGNPVIVDHCEIFASDTHNNAHLIGRPSTTQHYKIIQFITL